MNRSGAEPVREKGGCHMAWREEFLIRFGPGSFSGITLGLWWKVLRENRFAVDRPYWGRAALIALNCPTNTLLAACERLVHGRRARETKVEPPLFILGAWRSGTTLLHNLLAQDHRFAYPNNYQVFYPHTFLTTEAAHAQLVGAMFPKTRPQDNMTMGVREPQEDEFAIVALTGRGLPMGWSFPRATGFYDRYLTLRDLSPSELAEWKAALAGFVRKLAYKNGKPLVLKSPGHTGRIKRLLELFPDARFVHIHRNPYDVFQSTRHMIRKVAPWWALQRPEHGDLDDRVIRQYNEVYDAFFEERGLVPDGRFHELAFEALEADPVGQVQSLYEALALPDFQAARPALERYAASLANYKKNAYPPLPDDDRERVAREWRRGFEEWGYAR